MTACARVVCTGSWLERRQEWKNRRRLNTVRWLEYRQMVGGQQCAAVGFLVGQTCPGGVRCSHSGSVGEGFRGLPVWSLQLFWKPKMTSSVVQWLRIHLARKGMRVRSLVQERRSHMQLSPQALEPTRHNKRCASTKT